MAGFYTPLPEPFDPVADLARRQQLRANRLAMLQAERQMAQEDALAALAPGLGSPDPAKRTNVLAQIAALGPRGLALAAPLLQSEREAAALREALGAPEGIAPTPAAAALPAPAPGGAGFFDALRASENATGDPGARNPRSTATGDFQFIDSTWRRFAAAHPQLFQGMTDAQVLAARADPRLSRMAAEWYARENAGALSGAGLPVTPGTLALAHRFGAAGAQALLRAAPETPVGEVVGADVMRANPDLAGRTVGQVVGGFQARFGGAGAPAAAADVSGAGRGGLDPNALVQRAMLLQQRANAIRARAPTNAAARAIADRMDQQAMQMLSLAQRSDLLLPPEVEEQRIRIAQASRPQVNVDTRGEDTFARERGKALAERVSDWEAAGQRASLTEARLRRFEALNRQFETGALATTTLRAGQIAQRLGIPDAVLERLGISKDQVAAGEGIRSITGQMLVGMIGQGGFPAQNFSNADREMLERVMPGLANSPQGNRVIADIMRLGVQRDREIAAAWREWVRANGDSQESARRFQLERLPQITERDVLAPVIQDAIGEGEAPAPGPAQPEPPPAPAAPVRVRTPAEARTLPPGTLYVTPDGQTYRR